MRVARPTDFAEGERRGGGRVILPSRGMLRVLPVTCPEGGRRVLVDNLRTFGIMCLNDTHGVSVCAARIALRSRS